MLRLRALMEPQRDVGFRIGFVAIILIAITAAFPAFVQIGEFDPQIQSFSNMFTIGLIMTVFFSWALRDMSMRRQQHIRGGIYLDPLNVYKQVMVVLVGIAAGIVAVLVNIYTNMIGHQGNVLMASAFGTIDAKAFYLGMLAGVSEELFFRGFLQTVFEIFFGGTLLARLTAPIPAALIFAMFHFFAYSDPVVFVVLFMLGLIFGLLHSFTNDVGVPIVAHIVNNNFAMLGTVVTVIIANAALVFGLVMVAILMYFVAVVQTSKRKR